MHLNRIVIESGFRIWYFYRPVTTGSTGSDSRFTMIAAETILYVPQMSRNRIRISNLTFWPTGRNRKYRFNFRLLKIRDLSILYAHQKIRNSKEISNLWFLPTGHNQKYRFNFRLSEIRDFTILYAPQKIRNNMETLNLTFLPTGHNRNYRIIFLFWIQWL